MKVLVTGANGFVGRHLCTALTATGHDVKALASGDVDIAKPFKVKGHFDYAFHLAAYNITSVGYKDPESYQRINIEGTKNVIQGISCDHFIFLSTAKIYSDHKSEYAKSKEIAEKICQQYFKGKKLIIIRSVNILGKGQAMKAVLPVFIDKAKKNMPLDITVNPQTPINFIDVRDMVGLMCAMIRNLEHSGVYNASYPDHVTIKDLAIKVIAACHSSSTINQTTKAEPVTAIVFDCQKTWDDFKFKPSHDIDACIQEIIT